MAVADTAALCKTERLCVYHGAYHSTDPDAGSAACIVRAAQILISGGTVAFPTETVYGLGANALSPAAVERIFTAKSRPHWDPLIVHIADRAMLAQVAQVPVAIAPLVEALIAALWPGPLTLLLPRTSAIPDAVTAGRPLVGVRMPAHPIALALIRAAGVPIAAPSANRFGHTSPTSTAHVLDDLDGRIDAVLDGGTTQVGLESTVLDLTQTQPVIYRPGAITASHIADLIGITPILYTPPATPNRTPASLPSPGVGLRHYAPRARLILVGPNAGCLIEHPLSEGRTGILLPEGWPTPPSAHVFAWGNWDDHATLARRLYDGLRVLDSQGVATILCPVPPGEGLAAAIRDRLTKAARTV